MKLLRVGLVALGLCAASLPAGAPQVKKAPVQKSVPVKPVAQKPLVKPAEKAPLREVSQKSSVVDAVEFVYRRVDVLDAVNPVVIHFSSTETAANLKGAFASAQSHGAVSTSIVPAIKNLLEFVDGCVTQFSTKSIRELSRTLKIELKDPKESVLADFFFKKEVAPGSGKDTKITAYVTLKGLASAEPVYIRNLLAAALLEDSFWQMHGNKVLGGVAGVAGLSLLGVLANNQGWWPFGSNDDDSSDSSSDDSSSDGSFDDEEGLVVWENFNETSTSFVQLLRERVFADRPDHIDAHGAVTFSPIATKLVTSEDDALWGKPADAGDKSGFIAMVAVPGVLSEFLTSLDWSTGLRENQKRILVIPWSVFKQERLDPREIDRLNQGSWTVVVVNDSGEQEKISLLAFEQVRQDLNRFAFINVGAYPAAQLQPHIVVNKEYCGVTTKTVVSAEDLCEQMLECSVQALKYMFSSSACVDDGQSTGMSVDAPRGLTAPRELDPQDSEFTVLARPVESAPVEYMIEYDVQNWNGAALGVKSNNVVVLKPESARLQIGRLIQDNVCIVSPDCFELVRDFVVHRSSQGPEVQGSFIFVNVNTDNHAPCFEVLKVLHRSIAFTNEGAGPFVFSQRELKELPPAFTYTQADMIEFAKEWLKNPAQYLQGLPLGGFEAGVPVPGDRSRAQAACGNSQGRREQAGPASASAVPLCMTRDRESLADLLMSKRNDFLCVLSIPQDGKIFGNKLRAVGRGFEMDVELGFNEPVVVRNYSHLSEQRISELNREYNTLIFDSMDVFYKQCFDQENSALKSYILISPVFDGAPCVITYRSRGGVVQTSVVNDPSLEKVADEVVRIYRSM